MSEFLFKSIGDRITYCRSSLQLTRKELIDEWAESSLPTLVRWELGTCKVAKKKLPSLIFYFNKKGLIVTESWILDGSGSPPILIDENIFDSQDFDSLVQENYLLLNKKIKNFIFGQVKNNLLSPYIKYGDYVGGSDIPLEQLTSIIGEIVFFRKDNALFVGVLESVGEQITLRNHDRISQDSHHRNAIKSAGKIQWITRRP